MRRKLPIFFCICQLSAALAFQPDYPALRKLFEDALSRREREFGDADPRTAQAARDLGLFLCRSADRPSARRAMTRAVQLDEKALGPSAPQTFQDVATLASVSPPAEAEPLLRRAAESPDPVVAGPALTSLAQIRRAAGDIPAAAGFYRRALEQAEKADGPDGPTAALILNLLAQVVPSKEAVSLIQHALEIDQRQLGPDHPRTLQDAGRLAALLRSLGRVDEAAQLERRFKAAR